jgi:hypothetical protein
MTTAKRFMVKHPNTPKLLLRVNIYDDCEMTFDANPREQLIEFTFGTDDDGFDARFEREALRRCINVAEESLRPHVGCHHGGTLSHTNKGAV